ncbi:cation:dicarboxylate symporter family transporter [Staphylococcus aureus]
MFNLDGSALYQSIAALFVAQMYGMHLTLSEQIVLMLTLMITSKKVWRQYQELQSLFY